MIRSLHILLALCTTLVCLSCTSYFRRSNNRLSEAEVEHVRQQLSVLKQGMRPIEAIRTLGIQTCLPVAHQSTSTFDFDTYVLSPTTTLSIFYRWDSDRQLRFDRAEITTTEPEN